MLRDHAAVFLLINPLDMTILDANRAAIDYYGHGLDTLRGMSLCRLNTMSSPMVREKVDHAMSHGMVRFETRHAKADGTQADVEILSSKVITAQGFTALLAIIFDIGPRARALEALRESEEKFRLIGEQAMLCLAIIQDGRLTYANQALADHLGYQVGEMLDWPAERFMLCIHPADRAFAREQVRRKQQGTQGSVSRYRVRMLDKSGQIKHCELHGRTVQYNGRPADLVAVVDFSERKALEDERRALEKRLLQAQKMEAVGSLAAGVAHDFNNIMQSIGGHLELLALDGGLSAAGRERIGTLDGTIRRGASLVRRLLAFTRKEEPNFARVDLNELTRRTAELLRRTLPKSINIGTGSDGTNAVVAADEVMLEQVLLNLGANARDAMPGGGALLLATATALPRDTGDLPPGNYVLLRVADSGDGIEAEHIEKIFEPFFSTKEPGRGTGLGLSLARQVIEDHGGKITCHSAPGQGAAFDIYLPAARSALKEARPRRWGPADEPRGNDELVLLVDDEKPITESAGEYFRATGHRVLVAHSGERALELCAEHRAEVALVVLDLGMPGMGGMACLARLKERWPHLKVIVASGYATASGVADVMAAGADLFMPKPYSLPEMVANARRILAGTAGGR